MGGETWKRIDQLFHDAMARPAENRAEFLEQACPDEQLRHEVWSLLQAAPGAGSFLERPALSPLRAPTFRPDSRLVSFEFLELIGRGGMGEVYKARDTRLNRTVAIKILPEVFAQDVGRMARFEREARVLASLNHPNIAQIYDVEERALVMELVEGETLQGPLPLDTALSYAKQIAEALKAAHDKAIVHRDLKPANVMITPEGVVKLLDFGLARITEANATSDPTVSSTLAASPSYTGLIVGTVAYMAPEQARGKAVDRRADIWAFGCVLFEMLTGKPAFAGETTSDVLATIIKEEPNLAAVPADLRPVIAKCLRKNPYMRWQDIGDVWLALEEPSAPAALVAPAHSRSIVPWAIVIALLITTISLGFAWWRASRPVAMPLMTLSVDLGPDAILGRDTTFALSPDGARVVYLVRASNGKSALAVRLLSQAAGTALDGTSGAINPFFSPDSQSVGFFADNKLKRISVQGGPSFVLCDAPNGRGGSWGKDGYIVAALSVSGGLSRIPDHGGTPQRLTKLAGDEDTERWPQILPGGQAVLFTSSDNRTDWRNAAIEAVSLKTGKRKTVVRGGFFGRYLSNGELVFLRQSTLWAIPFDVKQLQVRGAIGPILEGVAGSSFGAGQYAFTQNGLFAYLPGELSTGDTQVAWMDSTGRTQLILSTPAVYGNPRLSPDGARLAFSTTEGIWIYDLRADTQTKVTPGGSNAFPVWSPDGKHVVYEARRGEQHALMWMQADGAATPQLLCEWKGSLVPNSFSPDGRWLAFHEESSRGIWILPINSDGPGILRPGKPEMVVHVPGAASWAAFSPDGNWLAYVSDESNTREVYVQPFKSGGLSSGRRWQVSSNGGDYPVWSPAHHELLFRSPDDHILAANYIVEGRSFQASKPHFWSEKRTPRLSSIGGETSFDVARDGRRLIVLAPSQADDKAKGNLHATFLLNFFDWLDQHVPKGK